MRSVEKWVKLEEGRLERKVSCWEWGRMGRTAVVDALKRRGDVKWMDEKKKEKEKGGEGEGEAEKETEVSKMS